MTVQMKSVMNQSCVLIVKLNMIILVKVLYNEWKNKGLICVQIRAGTFTLEEGKCVQWGNWDKYKMSNTLYIGNCVIFS